MMDKSSEFKDLDVTCAKRGVWLVKVPKYMSECWMKATPGEEVGKVVITTTTTKLPDSTKLERSNDVTFHLNEPLASEVLPTGDVTKVPTELKFVLKKKEEGRDDFPKSLFVLSTLAVPDAAAAAGQPSGAADYKAAIEGRVMDKAECRPTGGAGYMALKRSRLEAGNKPQKEVVQLSKPVNNYKPISIHESQLEYEQKKKEDGKKTRLDRDQVQELLFRAFEKHQYYNVKDLVRITNQPITFLKEVLKDLCTYNMKAPHKNMWELKEEYRHYKRTDKDTT